MSHTHTHTKTFQDGTTIDIFKLIENLESRAPINIGISLIKGPSRSKKSGFSSKRYEKADTQYPLIINEENLLIDGRHRLYKLIDQGNKTASVIIATKSDLENVIVKED